MCLVDTEGWHVLNLWTGTIAPPRRRTSPVGNGQLQPTARVPIHLDVCALQLLPMNTQPPQPTSAQNIADKGKDIAGCLLSEHCMR